MWAERWGLGKALKVTEKELVTELGTADLVEEGQGQRPRELKNPLGSPCGQTQGSGGLVQVGTGLGKWVTMKGFE